MPIRVINSNAFGESGVAEVSVTSKKIRVSFDNGVVFDVLPEDAPFYIKSGRQFVTLSSDGTRILYARPESGSFFVRFKEFSRQQDSPVPTPKPREATRMATKTGQKFEIPAGLDFTALLEIQKGKWAGYTVPYKLSYAFKVVDEDVVITGFGSKKCAEFLQVAGVRFESDTIPPSDNVLPFLEKLLKQRNKLMAIKIEDGWIKSIYEAPEDNGDDEEQEINQDVKEKPAKSSPKDVAPATAALIATMVEKAKQGDEMAKQILKELGHDFED